MNDAATLLALAERVEALTGSDRDVDADIAVLAIPDRFFEAKRDWQGKRVIGELCPQPDAPPSRSTPGSGYSGFLLVPRYTGSIDAAVTLIPDGVEWNMSTIYNVARATVGLNTDHSENSENKSCLPAPAIAAAALRFLAAEMED
jgi:hypothetical protein